MEKKSTVLSAQRLTVKNPDTAEAAIALIVSDTDANWRQKKRLGRRAHYIEQIQAGENCFGLA
jgi:hypothetical protein